MFNVEGMIPRLCELGQDLRDDDSGLRLRSAALQALASMVLHELKIIWSLLCCFKPQVCLKFSLCYPGAIHGRLLSCVYGF